MVVSYRTLLKNMFPAKKSSPFPLPSADRLSPLASPLSPLYTSKQIRMPGVGDGYVADGGGPRSPAAARVVVTYATVLPHEPLPIITSGKSIPNLSSHAAVALSPSSSEFHDAECNDALTQYGYVHIQGAFTPKQPANNDSIIASTSENNDESEIHYEKNTNSNNKCLCNAITYIEQTVQSNLTRLLSSFWMDKSEGSLLSVKILASSPTASTLTTQHDISSTNKNNKNYSNINNSISRIRLTTSNPYSARTIVSRLRRVGCSPQDLLVSTQLQSSSSSSSSSCSCPHGCGGRYSGKALQVTQVVPIITPKEDSCSNDENEHDEVVGGNRDENYEDCSSTSNSTRWPRAAPPKFCRLMLTSSTASTTNILSRFKGGGTQSSSLLVAGDEEMELECRRRKTRFVYVENIIDRTTTATATPTMATKTTSTSSHISRGNGENDHGNDAALIAECLLAFLHGMEGTQHLSLAKFIQSSSASSSSSSNDCEMRLGMVEDDIRHAFQDALRDALHRDLFSHAGSSPTAAAISASFKNTTQPGVELFLKPVTIQKKGNKHTTHSGGGGISDTSMTSHHHGVYNQLHMGMRSHEDATRLIELWQGKCITLIIQLPKSLLDLVTSSANQPLKIPTTTTISVQTGKLFLDYSDQKLPKRSKKVDQSDIYNVSTNQLATGYPYSSECTSTTDHVHIPGLYLLHNYIDSADMEQVLLAALAGPNASWAPRQYNQSGGSFKRRVQHYGYVFDYESSDVLRRDYDDDEEAKKDASRYEKEKTKHCCPPLPSIRPTRQSVLQMTDQVVEEYITSAVAHVKGWELLAGIIERTRRFNFDRLSSTSSFHDFETLATGTGNDTECTKPQKGASAVESPDASTQSLQQEQHQQQHIYPHINQLTINEYTPGQGIGSHVDTETAFDDGLLLITLGGGIVMEFREVLNIDGDDTVANNEDEFKPERRKKLMYLPPRSLVLLSGDARYKWEHMIVSRMTDTVNGKVVPRKLRVSLTLRTALTKPSTKVMDGSGQQQRQVQQIPLPIYETTIFPPRWGQSSEEDASASAVKHTAGSIITERSDLVTPNTESKHVHDVYDAIATQWHHTRGKRGVLWPGAIQFLNKLPQGSVVADVGCGDGKYFSAITAASSYVIGMDIS